MATYLVMADEQKGLAKRIPRDVRARVNKAGGRDLDWYAGRLESPAPRIGTTIDPHASARRARATWHKARARRRNARRDKRHDAVTKIIAALLRKHRRPSRTRLT